MIHSDHYKNYRGPSLVKAVLTGPSPIGGKIDEDITKAFHDDKLSIIEVDFALLMIHEKINQQKMELYNMYFQQKEEPEKEQTKDAPDNLYK